MPDAKRRPIARRPTRIAAHLLTLATALAGGPLLAGPPPATVRGKIIGLEKLSPQVYVEAKDDPRRWTWREPSPTVKQEFRRLTANPGRDVCVAAFSGGPPQPHEPVAIKLTGGRLTPATIVLSPGSRLSFKNVDPFPHALYEVNADRTEHAEKTTKSEWGPNVTAPGSTREWSAGSAGTHEIRDQLFPSIVMYVVVDPAAVEFATPDREGTFAMALPAGDYTFKTFFDGKPVTREVSGLHVGDRGLVELREPMTVGGDSK